MAISLWKSCGTVSVVECNFVYHDTILLIEKISFVLLIFLLIGGVLYILLSKDSSKKKMNYQKIFKKYKMRIVLYFSSFLLLLCTTFLYTFLDHIIPRDYMRECQHRLKTECSWGGSGGFPVVYKPIIYLYPENKQEIMVELEVEWKLIADYPEYNSEIKWWDVVAYPDGKVEDNGKEYSYLFWEALFDDNSWNLDTWFIVEWKNARSFLEEKLSYIWLTAKEYNEFIVYWYPKMMENKYNLVYFAWEDYNKRAPLKITPQPDSLLRVFTVIQPLDEKVEIEEQKLEKFERKWFSVIEWGGTLLEKE